MSRRVWLVGGFAVALLLAAIVAVFPAQVLPGVALWLDVGERPRPADYVMVMPGDEETRPFIAAGMVRRGLARAVLVPTTADGPLTEDGIARPNHELIRQILNVRGVDDERIVFLGRQSSSSWDDAEALAEFLASRPGSTVAVVTSDYHTRRSRWVFRRVLRDQANRLFFVSAPSDYFSPHDWWLSKSGLRTYAAEYSKFAVYLVQYGGLGVWIPALAILVAIACWPLMRGSTS